MRVDPSPSECTAAPTPPAYSRGERQADGVMHALGVVSAPPAALILLLQIDGPVQMLGGAAFALGLIAMVYCSALYHWTQDGARKAWFRRADRAAIFGLIAGTYSAYLAGPLGAAVGASWAGPQIAVIWLSALSAAYLEIRHPRRYERTTLALALLLGWCGLVLIGPMLDSLSAPVLLGLAAGGFVYTIGVGFHLWRRLPYHNAVWHGCVLLAAGCHYTSIFLMVSVH